MLVNFITTFQSYSRYFLRCRMSNIHIVQDVRIQASALCLRQKVCAWRQLAGVEFLQTFERDRLANRARPSWISWPSFRSERNFISGISLPLPHLGCKSEAHSSQKRPHCSLGGSSAASGEESSILAGRQRLRHSVTCQFGNYHWLRRWLRVCGGEKTLCLWIVKPLIRKLFELIQVVVSSAFKYKYFQVDDGRKEKLDLSRVCDIEDARWKAPSNFKGDTVIVGRGEDRLCGTVLGAFRLPWMKENVVIVRHLLVSRCCHRCTSLRFFTLCPCGCRRTRELLQCLQKC